MKLDSSPEPQPPQELHDRLLQIRHAGRGGSCHGRKLGTQQRDQVTALLSQPAEFFALVMC